MQQLQHFFADPNPQRTAQRRVALSRPVFWIMSAVSGLFTILTQLLDVWLPGVSPEYSIWAVLMLLCIVVLAPFVRLWPLTGQVMCLLGLVLSLYSYWTLGPMLLPTLVIYVVVAYCFFSRRVSILFLCIYLVVVPWLAWQRGGIDELSLALGVSSNLWGIWWMLDTMFLYHENGTLPQPVRQRPAALMIALSVIVLVALGMMGLDSEDQTKLNTIKLVGIVGLWAVYWRRPDWMRTALNALLLLVMGLMFTGAPLERVSTYMAFPIVFLFIINLPWQALLLSVTALATFFALHIDWIVAEGWAMAARTIMVSLGLIGLLWFSSKQLLADECLPAKGNGLAAMFLMPRDQWRIQVRSIVRDIAWIALVFAVLVYGLLSSREIDIVTIAASPEAYRTWWLWFVAICSAILGLLLVRAQIEGRKKILAQALLAVEKYAHQASLAEQRAVQANSTRDAFLKSVSQEIRTPLQSIHGVLPLMTSLHRKGESMANELELMQQMSQRVLQMVVSLLDVSRLLSTQETVQESAVSLGDMLTPLMQKYQQLADAQGVELVLGLAAKDQIFVLVDEGRLAKVLELLVAEALSQSEVKSVQIGVISTQEHVVIAIYTDGAELSPAHLRVFADIDAPLDSFEHPASISLALCQRMLQEMGGQLAIMPRAQKGMAFEVTLKRVPLAAYEAQI